ncbi:MAG: ROK family protein [Streptococcus sp.]
MILAIDIGGTFIKFGLVDNDFKISNQSKVSTPTTLDGFWLTLEHIVSSHKDIISGIAIACPGEINSKRGFIFQGRSYPLFNSYSSAGLHCQKFQLPVKVINDADSCLG